MTDNQDRFTKRVPFSWDTKPEIVDWLKCPMTLKENINRQLTVSNGRPNVPDYLLDAVERLVVDAPDKNLNRIGCQAMEGCDLKATLYFGESSVQLRDTKGVASCRNDESASNSDPTSPTL